MIALCLASVRTMQLSVEQATGTVAHDQEGVTIPRSATPLSWIFAGIVTLVGCRSDTTRPREVAPTPNVTPKATPYPPQYKQAGQDSSSRARQTTDSGHAMPSIRLVWPDTTTRTPSAP